MYLKGKKLIEPYAKKISYRSLKNSFKPLRFWRSFNKAFSTVEWSIRAKLSNDPSLLWVRAHLIGTVKMGLKDVFRKR